MSSPLCAFTALGVRGNTDAEHGISVECTLCIEIELSQLMAFCLPTASLQSYWGGGGGERGGAGKTGLGST